MKFCGARCMRVCVSYVRVCLWGVHGNPAGHCKLSVCPRGWRLVHVAAGPPVRTSRHLPIFGNAPTSWLCCGLIPTVLWRHPARGKLPHLRGNSMLCEFTWMTSSPMCAGWSRSQASRNAQESNNTQHGDGSWGLVESSPLFPKYTKTFTQL